MKRTVCASIIFCVLSLGRIWGDEDINGFVIRAPGRIGTEPKEVVEGTRSVVAGYEGRNSYTDFLTTDPRTLPLRSGGTYTVRFKYKVIAAPDKGFEVVFYSPTGGARNHWLPSKTFGGKAGEGGAVVLTNTLGSYEDYQIVWNIVGRGAVAIDAVILDEAGKDIVREGFEEPRIVTGRLPFAITDTRTFPLGAERLVYMLRSAAAADLDGDGTAEAVLTVTTYAEQIPQPILILGAKTGIEELTPRFFPGGIPRLRHSPYTFFYDLNMDGKKDLILSEAGLDHEPWTGARPVLALQNDDGSFRDISEQIPRDLWETRSYARALGDLNGDGLPEVILPDQGRGKNTALLAWKKGSLQVNRRWIPPEIWSWPDMLSTNNNLCIADLDQDGREDLIVGGANERPNLRIVFGGPGRFGAGGFVTLPDGPFGHTGWETREKKETLVAQGADVIGLLVADFDNDGLKDILLIHEDVRYYKPGVFADALHPERKTLFEKGGSTYGTTALQVFRNLGGRRFAAVDQSPAPATLGWRNYLALFPLDLNGDGFLDFVDGYWTKPYGAQKGSLYGSTVFLNDGTGCFQVIEDLFPSWEARGTAAPEPIGVFVPTGLADKRLEGLFVSSRSDSISGTLVARKAVCETVPGTGPGLTDSAALGFPGFNEYYYLRTHPDAAAAVKAGTFPNGLAHYQAVGLARGYQAFAANARVRGGEGRDTLVLAVKKADARLSREGGGWKLVDATGKYGTLRLEGIEAVAFIDERVEL